MASTKKTNLPSRVENPKTLPLSQKSGPIMFRNFFANELDLKESLDTRKCV